MNYMTDERQCIPPNSLDFTATEPEVTVGALSPRKQDAEKIQRANRETMDRPTSPSAQMVAWILELWMRLDDDIPYTSIIIHKRQAQNLRVRRDIKEKELAFKHHQDCVWVETFWPELGWYQSSTRKTCRKHWPSWSKMQIEKSKNWKKCDWIWLWLTITNSPGCICRCTASIFLDYSCASRNIKSSKRWILRRVGASEPRYEQKLAQEKDDKVRLRGQAGIHQKYHIDLHLGGFCGQDMSKPMDLGAAFWAKGCSKIGVWDLFLRQSSMMTSEENVKQKANENRKAEERILGLMKALRCALFEVWCRHLRRAFLRTKTPTRRKSKKETRPSRTKNNAFSISRSRLQAAQRPVGLLKGKSVLVR